jgi:hypothetical protein
MPDMVHMQFTQSNAYLTQLLEQFTRIEKRIEGGETVTLNLTEGDRAISLIVSRDRVVEGALPVVRLPTAKPQTLVDNDSLIAGITKTFNFDLGEVARNIAPAEIHRHITKAIKRKTAVGSERHVTSVSELPVRQSRTTDRNGSGPTIVRTGLWMGSPSRLNMGSRPIWRASPVFYGPASRHLNSRWLRRLCMI